MIEIRIDVDYPYPSRVKSFLLTVLNSKTSKDYLKNSKIIARMINESTKNVRAYWFFTPQTIPDNELMILLGENKHEIALHVANDAVAELDNLKRITRRNIRYYTIHGTARLPARLMWRRKIWEDKAQIPLGFPLQSFYRFPTLGFDLVCYRYVPTQAVRIAESSIAKGEVLHIHPEWLFQKGIVNHRGAFYRPLKQILQVDEELEGLVIRKKGFAKIASYGGTSEYEYDRTPAEALLEKLAQRGIDIFTFIERKWCCSIINPPKKWMKAEDNVAILRVTTYSDWWKSIGKKTRNMVRKAEKNCVTIQVVEPSEKLAEGIWRIYNETPIRQGRSFLHYGAKPRDVKASVLSSPECIFIGAFLQNELVGFIQVVHGDDVAIISQILSLQKFWDTGVNNALISKAVEYCAVKRTRWIMYGRMGNHPSLDNFKENNNFRKISVARYYVPLTTKGKLAMGMRLHREIKDTLPQNIKRPLLPAFNWASRAKMKVLSLLQLR